MFQKVAPRSNLQSGLNILELVYHSIVRSVRQTHGNAIVSLLMNMMQAAIMLAMFYVMMLVLGMRTTAIRGDFMLYIMSGIFLYMTHVKTVSAVAGSEGPSSGMMLHAPMNTVISMLSTALSALYLQVLTMFTLLFLYFMLWQRFEIDQPLGAFGMLLAAWYTGAALGLLLLAIKPWFPVAVGIMTTVYTRASMIASGKMFVANTTPEYLRKMFDWHPLFHVIDQCRGYVFINYTPHHSNYWYSLAVGLTLMTLGLMGEFYTRRSASKSWNARR